VFILTHTHAYKKHILTPVYIYHTLVTSTPFEFKLSKRPTTLWVLFEYPPQGFTHTTKTDKGKTVPPSPALFFYSFSNALKLYSCSAWKLYCVCTAQCIWSLPFQIMYSSPYHHSCATIPPTGPGIQLTFLGNNPNFKFYVLFQTVFELFEVCMCV
jgi:hypothetical protein